MKINSETQLLGIIGYPIKHSLSPTLHTTLAKKYNLNFVYLSFEVLPSKFNQIKNAILTLNIRGINVTVPYKERIIPYLDKLDKLAEYIKAVNTVFNNNGKLIGYNTDIYGFTKSLKDVDIKDEEGVVIGCGGVSKAIICGLEELGVKKVYIYDIDNEKVVQTKYQFKDFVVPLKKEDIKNVMLDVRMIINATPLGMKENDPSPVPLECIKKEHIVYDVIYNRETELIKYARQLGCKHVYDGILMFVYQAAEAFFIWTGVAPDTNFMLKLVKKLILRGD